MSEWQLIETAPKDEDTPILVVFDHDADPYHEGDSDLLTDYACHAEGGDFFAGRGVAIAVWRDGWHESEGYEDTTGGYWLPGAWFAYYDGDAGDHVVNATHWMPLPAPPTDALTS